MGLLTLFGFGRTALRERREPTLAPVASLDNPTVNLSEVDGTWFADWAMGGAAAKFGPAVNERTAMAVSAVFRCVTLISGLIANLPLKVFERTPEGRREATEHRLNRLLKLEPMPGSPMVAHQFKEVLAQSMLMHGNGYAIIRYDQAARVVGLELVLPWLVEILRTTTGRRVYRVSWDDGRPVEYIDWEDMLHVAGPGFDGVQGVSRIRYAAGDSIGLAKLLEEQTGFAHANASSPSVFVEAPANMKPDSFKRFKAQWAQDNGGWRNAGKAYFGDAGSKLTVLQMKPVDLATIDSRRYQVADISRFFGVPLSLLNETDKSTSWGSGIAEQHLAFLGYTLDADLSRIENVLNARLLGDGRYYVEFERSALLAMDPVTSAEVMQTEISSGVLTINEARSMRNRPPVEGGDTPLVNSTNKPLDQQLAPPKPPPPQKLPGAI
ncbi:phage portal protein [Paracraurococcus lichenis]|uniref:Phage portal protein n=1 Tax=Paracraurococcus lichenis TaxID=3064888 RepID=A0ABT9E8B4_9PROT|nr:phage portal protein [Paracraurococcus sp. LOR1-02]MDO9712446.1 phage portal protein [Paracraurococcus sp. LOR1-02]